ncbi:MAG: hypothetical protein ABGY41_16950, partial [Candidatus Poribacteria bacterium]
IDPCWSPDGTEILFTSQRDVPRGLFVINVNDLSIRRVTEGIWGQFRAIDGSSWYDPSVPRNVSPVGRHATTWGWMKRLGATTQ